MDSPDLDISLLDPESTAEMVRLINLDRLTTQAMGEPLAGFPDPSQLHSILDLACGPGGWVLDVAFAHPEVDVAGVDVSNLMEIAYQSGKSMLVKAGMATQAEADQLYNQIIIELMVEDFGHMWHYQTVQGVKP